MPSRAAQINDAIEVKGPDPRALHDVAVKSRTRAVADRDDRRPLVLLETAAFFAAAVV